ncbi:hypothetical protein GWI33_004742 [Rhynchophorus ferrugineus]|uniref:Uncharacterized protein n=1 Tax=Rhynchophorus ferrugineus TaxID=354439 RepID=A0A834IM01_RHYFE|nr:hypothetical protein GWI33_004742 [Rhynchophorus ferrugineus]
MGVKRRLEYHRGWRKTRPLGGPTRKSEKSLGKKHPGKEVVPPWIRRAAEVAVKNFTVSNLPPPETHPDEFKCYGVCGKISESYNVSDPS